MRDARTARHNPVRSGGPPGRQAVWFWWSPGNDKGRRVPEGCGVAWRGVARHSVHSPTTPIPPPLLFCSLLFLVPVTLAILRYAMLRSFPVSQSKVPPGF